MKINWDKVLGNLQTYFGICFFYLLYLKLKIDKLSVVGYELYKVLFFLTPILIIGPFVYLFILRKNKLQRNDILVLTLVAITIIIFECFLLKK